MKCFIFQFAEKSYYCMDCPKKGMMKKRDVVLHRSIDHPNYTMDKYKKTQVINTKTEPKFNNVYKINGIHPDGSINNNNAINGFLILINLL